MVSLEESSVLLPSVRSGDVYTLLPSGRAGSAGPVLPPVTALAETLRSVLGTVRQLEREPPARVVLARPAAWAGPRQSEFAEMARVAGLPEAEFISETDSIVTYFASRGRLKDDDLVAVHDLGGRSFGAAVARYTSSGISVIGERKALTGVSGEVFDDLVMAHVNQATGGALTGLDLTDPALAAARQRVREQCVRAKEALSQDDEARVVVLLPGRHTEVRITRAEFESLIRDKVKATVAALGEAIESTGSKSSDLVALLLVGGSSRIPEIVKAVSAEFGRPVLTDPHPQHCVTLGAAFIAGGTSIVDASEAALAGSAGRAAGRRRPRDRTSATVRFAPVLSSAGSAPPAPAAAGAAPAIHRPDRPDRPDSADRAAGSPRPTRKWGRWVIVGLLVLALLGGGGAYLERSRSGREVEALAGPSATVAALPLLPSASVPPTSTPATSTGKSTARPTRKAALAPARKPAATSSRAAAAKPKATTRPKTTTVKPVLGTGFLVGPGGKCLDVQNRVSKPGQLVQIYECNQSTAQIWTASGTSIKALGFCLDSATADGQMQINTCNGSAGQKWQIRGTTVINTSTSTCLDVLGGSADDYTPTVSLTCRASTRQTWKLT